MNNDLISREALKEEVKTLFCPDGYKIMMLERINNAPTVDIKEQIAGAYNEGYMCGSREAEKARTQGKCKACDYYKLAQSFINGIVEVISKNGLTSIDELLEILNREANNNG